MIILYFLQFLWFGTSFFVPLYLVAQVQCVPSESGHSEFLLPKEKESRVKCTRSKVVARQATGWQPRFNVTQPSIGDFFRQVKQNRERKACGKYLCPILQNVLLFFSSSKITCNRCTAQMFQHPSFFWQYETLSTRFNYLFLSPLHAVGLAMFSSGTVNSFFSPVSV